MCPDKALNSRVASLFFSCGTHYFLFIVVVVLRGELTAVYLDRDTSCFEIHFLFWDLFPVWGGIHFLNFFLFFFLPGLTSAMSLPGLEGWGGGGGQVNQHITSLNNTPFDLQRKALRGDSRRGKYKQHKGRRRE